MVREFFDRMPKNKDITAWNAMINAYANAAIWARLKDCLI
jgi:hypothetical protein